MGCSSKIVCMNRSCATPTCGEWKRGWPLRSGGFALLCFNCGSAYENSVFCEKFHFAETGWRECSICGKHLHCGCIASACSLELLDYGGIGCTTCWNTSRLSSVRSLSQSDDRINLLMLKCPTLKECEFIYHLIYYSGPEPIPSDWEKGQVVVVPPSNSFSFRVGIPRHGIHNGFGTSTLHNAGDQSSTHAQTSETGNSFDERKLMQLCNLMAANEPNFLPHSQRRDINASIGNTHGDGVTHTVTTQPSTMPPITEAKNMHESQADPSLSMRTPNFVLPSPCMQGQTSRPIFSKPQKVGAATSSETNKGFMPNVRVARPPGDGRGKNQLLPRYWPRITDQELQKLSGDLNSTIVPLFEKILSASDAGRIGRLVLPKACAEAYFPPISQSEGLPLHIQDVKGKEWTFQFRFWPNNNSRMYVLEGVTPCIQSMQLQAGDTVIFSRIDPGGKLVMGFRKSSHSVVSQDYQCSSLPSGNVSGDASVSGVTENMPTVGSYSSLCQTQSETKDSNVSNSSLPDTAIGWSKIKKHGGRTTEDSRQQQVLISDKRRAQNIGVKTKRLRMHSEDAMELRLTWEEAQDLLRPPPTVKPVVVTIEGHEFEEYNEPPVFGKKTIFTARSSREQDQWAQCDDCLKWRRLPVDALIPPRWTCSNNVWDPSRCSCSTPDDMCPTEHGILFRASKDLNKRRLAESNRADWDHEPCGLDALASAAVLGDNTAKEGDSGDPSIGATTKHPRHRPGCTCIVCIQPPSGKGKHKATCTCNVCTTVRRRFKTLMLRKKRRQFEREAEHSQVLKDQNAESETNDTYHAFMHMNNLESKVSHNRMQSEVAETSTGQIDLNCDPSREEDMQADEAGGSPIPPAALPLENYMNQNGVGSSECEQPDRPVPHLPAAAAGAGETETCLVGEGQLASLIPEQQQRMDGPVSD